MKPLVLVAVIASIRIIAYPLGKFCERSVSHTFNPESKWYSTFGLLIWGLAAGGLSLWAMPHAFIASSGLRLLALLVLPLAAGVVAQFVADVLEWRGHDLTELNRFRGATAFAFAIALMRYTFAQ